MRRRSCLLCPALLAVMAACSPITIDYQRDPFAHFPDRATYAWLDASGRMPNISAQRAADLTRRVRQYVDRELARKNYTPVTGGPPDYLVCFHAAVQGDLSSDHVNSVYGSWGYDDQGRWGFGPDRRPEATETARYAEGSIVIDVLDPATKRPLWRGVATANVRADSTPEENDPRVREGVRMIFAGFPPR